MKARNISGYILTLLFALVLLLAGPALADPAQLGVYRGAGDTGVRGIAATEAWLGRQVPRALDFLFFTSWGDCNAAQTPCSLGGWAIGQWAKQGRPVTFGLPLTIAGTPLADVAAGKHDDAYALIARTLVAKGMATAILRLGWEFNGGWYPWAAAKDPAGFKAAWVRVVTVMRAVPGAAFRFDWNPALGQLGIKPDQVYPGDAYVDVIGMDAYCNWWTAADQTDAARRWATLRDQGYGLAWHAAFAKAHGKPMSFPEWGTGTRPDGHGCGDDPVFVTNMLAWIAANAVLYQDYWDYPASDYNARLSDDSKPLAGAVFRQLMLSGPASPEIPAATPADPDMLELAALRQQAAALQAQLDQIGALYRARDGADAALRAALGGGAP